MKNLGTQNTRIYLLVVMIAAALGSAGSQTAYGQKKCSKPGPPIRLVFHTSTPNDIDVRLVTTNCFETPGRILNPGEQVGGESNAQSLTVRNAHSMVFDSENKRILLFGGADEKRVYGDLWVLKGKRWKPVNTYGPGDRTFASMVYDAKSRRVILFGGNRVLFGSKNNPPVMLNDTWELRKNRWRELNPTNKPEPRAEAAIAYDEAGKRIVLFGGYKPGKEGVIRFSDTWEFKNDRWTRLRVTGPTARNGAAMTFDANLRKLILFGGSTIDKKYGARTGETWVLENDNWIRLEIDQPENIFNSNLAFQRDTGRLIRFGGWNGKARTDETWAFENSKWKMLPLTTRPAARNHAAMVYDSFHKRTILFGGHNGEKIFGDLWIFQRGKWYKELEHTPIKRINNGH